MNQKNKRMLWERVDTVLLDIDGTLIDQHYEDYFWDNLVPRMYAKKHKLPLKEARLVVQQFYKEQAGTRNWSDTKFWERTMELKLKGAKKSLKHLIKSHPHTVKFLKFLRKNGKKVYIITACPQDEIAFKMKTAGISKYFDGAYSEADIDKTKTDKAFWKWLSRNLAFDKNRTLFADDRQDVLKMAKSYGIKHLVLKGKFSSRKPARKSKEFISVRHFDDIIS